MKTPLRVTLAIAVFVGVYIAGWFAAMISQLGQFSAFVALAMAGAATWFVWRESFGAHNSPIRSGVHSGIVFGAIAAAAGFFAPMIIMPAAAQGPLIALFTAPVGIVFGVFFGYSRARRTLGGEESIQ